ncbi:MAG: hypothetical protein ACREDH_05635, partial [Methylocella sp.]
MTWDPPRPQFHALLARLNFISSWACARLRPALLVLGIVLGLVPSTAPARLRSALLVFGIILGLSGLWMLLPELLRAKPIGLAFDRASADAAAAHRTGAVLAAEIGVIRGDLWAEAAFTGARFMWTPRSTIHDWTNHGQLARARADAETALALAPVNGAAWLFLAKLPAVSPEAENRVRTLLEMSYFTAPNALSLAPWRLERAATSSALADKDFQAFIKGDIRGVLDRGPEYRQAIIAAYRNAWPQNKPIFESLVADADPAMAQLLRSGQP